MAREPALIFTSKGVYCPAGDFYIDPTARVARALITHGHADHARKGHGHYLCTQIAAPTLRHRLGNISLQTLPYSQPLSIGDAQVTFFPAGHIPGSAQIRVTVAGETWVAAGDFKLENDGLTTPFEPVTCHHFITESTFGLPVFRWRAQAVIAEQMNAWWAQSVRDGITPCLSAYSLGKAQRLLSLLDTNIGPILAHSAIENTNAVLRNQGIRLPDTQLLDTIQPLPKNAIVIASPTALRADWGGQSPDLKIGFASGWMALPALRKSRGGDKGFVLSDHADWPDLLRAITMSKAENIYVTHGYTSELSQHLNQNGWRAQAVHTGSAFAKAGP